MVSKSAARVKKKFRESEKRDGVFHTLRKAQNEGRSATRVSDDLSKMIRDTRSALRPLQQEAYKRRQEGRPGYSRVFYRGASLVVGNGSLNYDRNTNMCVLPNGTKVPYTLGALDQLIQLNVGFKGARRRTYADLSSPTEPTQSRDRIRARGEAGMEAGSSDNNSG